MAVNHEHLRAIYRGLTPPLGGRIPDAAVLRRAADDLDEMVTRGEECLAGGEWADRETMAEAARRFRALADTIGGRRDVVA